MPADETRGGALPVGRSAGKPAQDQQPGRVCTDKLRRVHGSSTDESGAPSPTNLTTRGATHPDKKPDGVFFIDSKTPMRKIADGSSNTIVISECLVGRPDIREMPSDGANDKCWLGAAPDGAGALIAGWTRGNSWFFSQMVQSWGFSTLMTPNAPINFECFRFTTRGFYAARSDHPGGANAGFADGSVRFIADDVDPLAWQAAGTIARGETAGQL